MTKIAIVPNAAGTGTFTIEAPNSNSNRTLTLPDAAGTVFLSDGAGTIQPTNVSDGTLSIPTTFVTNGSAKAWANFTGTGTATINDSFNHTSLTDNGTGDYTLNLTSSMANASYSFNYSGQRSATNDLIFVTQKHDSALAVGSYRPRSFHFSDVASPVGEDAGRIGTSINGDLA
jgi:hypothetical protein